MHSGLEHESMSKSDIPFDLIKSFQEDRVHLFVGSGVSTAALLPSWDALIQEMKDIIAREHRSLPKGELDDFIKTADNLDIAQAFLEAVKPHRYFRFLREH